MRVWAVVCLVSAVWGAAPAVAPAETLESGAVTKGGGTSVAPAHPQGLIFVPAGTVGQGCNPGRHGRCLGQHVPPFYIEPVVVTREAYQKCLDAGVCATPPTFHDPTGHAYDSAPPAAGPADAALVSYDEAEQYCRWRELRLPTEAEWERAREATPIGPSMGQGRVEWLAGWYTWFGRGFQMRRITSGWIYNSRLVVTMHGGSYRYGQDPQASGQVGFRCVDGDPPRGGGTEEAAWAQDILR